MLRFAGQTTTRISNRSQEHFLNGAQRDVERRAAIAVDDAAALAARPLQLKLGDVR